MHTLEEIVQAVLRLPHDERKRLIERLQDNDRETRSEGQRRAALKGWSALAGAFHTDFTDVSTDKYKHLADAYSDDR